MCLFFAHLERCLWELLFDCCDTSNNILLTILIFPVENVSKIIVEKIPFNDTSETYMYYFYSIYWSVKHICLVTKTLKVLDSMALPKT